MKPFRSSLSVAVLSVGAIAAGYFGGRPLLERYEFARAESQVNDTRQQLNTVEDLSTVFRHVGKVVEPSVVNIKVHKLVKETSSAVPRDELRKFFQDRGQYDVPFNFNFGDGNGGADEGPAEQIGEGSGVIMDVSDGYGYILTNNHVAGGASKIEVTLADGRTVSGTDVKVLGADPKSDLAVVQIKADRLIPAQWGDSDQLEKGDWIMAFGSPYDYIGSMTHGIVSALNRTSVVADANEYQDFIQVDAPINPGNSGGPLVNIRGEVVGINTAIATTSGGFQGIGFAIPSNEARQVYGSLKEHGKVIRGWLGVQIEDASKEIKSLNYFGYKGTNGVLVNRVYPGTPAYGKLHHGDVITAYNGKPVSDTLQLRSMVAATQPNTNVTLTVFHDEKNPDQKVDITLGSQPEDLNAFASGNPNGSSDDNGAGQTETSNKIAGITLGNLDDKTAEQLGVGNIKGAVITDVDAHSPAADAGLAPGMVITMVGKTEVHNTDEAMDALKKADLKQGIPLYVTFREGSRFVFLQSDDSTK
jgi:serine protease Do